MATRFPSTLINSEKFEDKISNLHRFNFTSYDLKYIYRIQSIRQILPWFIISIGIIGNLFILLIFIKRKTPKGFSSNAFCFCALAISDSLALIFMLLRSMIKLNVMSDMTIACKLIKFTYHFSLQVSSWCLVLLSIDRLIAVAFIFKYKKWSKNYSVIKILIVFILMIVLFNIHLIVFTESKVKKDDIFDYTTKKISSKFQTTSKMTLKQKYACTVDSIRFPNYSKFIFDKWDIYHGIIYGAFPFLIILACNIIIILKLTFLKNSQFIQVRRCESTKSLDKIDKSIKSFQITVMLLSIAFIFLLFTSPISIYMAFIYPNLTRMNEVKKEYIKIVLRYIGYCNNAINFYVYICLSSEFRKEFGNLWRLCFKFKPISSTVSKCTTSTSLASLNNQDKMPLPPITKPIVRKGLKFNKYNEKENTNSTELHRPFLNKQNSEDGVEKFKQHTKSKQLTFYKSENNPSLNKSMDKRILIEDKSLNTISTYV
ncbi:unnamed protein product [Brachionus calyciflorus]|uniref:G-protein coupled receptors family 1 profile domain-containing protein n=1 Tax=Brachionus calyciflorus TaxID=104777 RepID=A0A813PTI6_9BILA|nr:unnamed protein product [Brachionus calyciflorus]